MVGNKCHFINCVNTSAHNRELRFFRFPANDKERSLAWIKLSGNDALLELTEHFLGQRYVCSAHFRPDQVLCSGRLFRNANPTAYDEPAVVYPPNIVAVPVDAAPADAVPTACAFAIWPILSEPAVKMEPDTSPPSSDFETEDCRIKTEDVDISDYECDAESVDWSIRPENMDISDQECENEPDPVETVYMNEEHAEEMTNAEASMAEDPLSGPPQEQCESTHVDRRERISLPSTSSYTSFARIVSNNNFPAKQIVMGNSERFKNSRAPSRTNLAESDKRVNSVAKAAKQSVVGIPRYTPQSFACDLCRAKFPMKSSLIRHVAICFKMSFGPRLAAEIRARNNENKTSSGETFSCSCKMTFKDISSLEKHVLYDSKVGCFIVSCNFCSKVFDDLSSREQHLLTHTGENKYECKFCLERFSHSDIRDKHMLTHSGEEQKYRCTICEQGFMQEYQWKEHLLCHHTLENKHVCKFCLQLFNHISRRDKHMLTHTGEMEFACKFCWLLFSQSSSRDKHMLTHSGENKYACKFCTKLFSQSSIRNKHMQTHSGEKPFGCQFCFNRFALAATRDKHVRAHTGDRKFTCEFCLELFDESGTKDEHLLTHTGEKNYSCTACPKLFSRNITRNAHLKSHEKLQECEFCSRRFIRAASKNRHMLTHTEEKKYTCPHCPEKFSRRAFQFKHLVTHIGEKSTNATVVITI